MVDHQIVYCVYSKENVVKIYQHHYEQMDSQHQAYIIEQDPLPYRYVVAFYFDDR